MEQWVKIIHNTNYEVSNLGSVRRITPSRTSKPGPIKSSYISKGYLAVWLPTSKGHGKNYLIHRLVAEAFIGLASLDDQVNHKDGNKSNNHWDNLEYVSLVENVQHAWRTGLNKGPRSAKSGSAKLTTESVSLIRELLPTKSHTFLARAFRVRAATIKAISSGKSWR